MADLLHRYVLHNLGLKILAIGLAVALWLVVARDPVDEVAINVPVEFHNIPGNLEIATDNIPRAQILLRGPERLIHRMQPTDVHVEVDLSGTSSGERTFDLSTHQVHVPRGLEATQVIPSQLHMAFDERMTREVPIQPRVIGSFAGGQKLGKVQSDPALITISGPRKRVAAVEAAITDPVDVTGTLDHNTFVTRAYVTDPLVQVVKPGPVRVTVIMEKAPADPSGR